MIRLSLCLMPFFFLAACEEGDTAEAETPSVAEAGTNTGASDSGMSDSGSSDSGSAADDTASSEGSGVRGPIIVGDRNAPVTIKEYASLTCPACRQFHSLVYPEVKEKLIDTGKVQFHFYNFVIGGRLDLAASSIVRCTTQEAAEKMLKSFFRQQVKWARSKDPVSELAALARPYGISRVAFDACLQDTSMHKHLAAMSRQASDDGITATPTLIVGDQTLESYSFEKIEAAVADALK